MQVMLPDGVEVTYRYAVCMFVPPDPYEGALTGEKVIVRRWETNLKPRKIACHGTCLLFFGDSMKHTLIKCITNGIIIANVFVFNVRSL